MSEAQREQQRLLSLCAEAQRLRLRPAPLLRGWRADQLIFAEATESIERELSALRARLVVLLLGGTGVGKSTFLNALAGEKITETSNALRAHTQNFAVYAHEESSLEGLTLGSHFERHQHRIEGLRDKLILDAPDIDSIESAHEEKVRALLPAVDLVIYLTSWQKYKDQHCSALLRGLRGNHRFLFVLNQIDQVPEKERALLRGDFQTFLERLGFQDPPVMMISALSACRGNSAREGDLPQLKKVLHGALEARALLQLKGSGALRRLRSLVAQTRRGSEGAPSSFARWSESAAILLERLAQVRQVNQDALEADLYRFTELLTELLLRDGHRQREQGSRGIYGLFLKLQTLFLQEEGSLRGLHWAQEQARCEVRFGRILERLRATFAEVPWLDFSLTELEARRESSKLIDQLYLEFESSARLGLPPPRDGRLLNLAPWAGVLCGVAVSVVSFSDLLAQTILAPFAGLFGAAFSCSLQEKLLSLRDQKALREAIGDTAARLTPLIEKHSLFETLTSLTRQLEETRDLLQELALLQETLDVLKDALDEAPEGVEDLLVLKT